jgi:hypothetical protein
MLGNTGPDLNALAGDDEAWAAYELQDQDVRRARWTAIVAGYVLGQDVMVRKLIGPLTLAELIDLDASLTGLRHEVRRVISGLDAPWAKAERTQPDQG